MVYFPLVFSGNFGPVSKIDPVNAKQHGWPCRVTFFNLNDAAKAVQVGLILLHGIQCPVIWNVKPAPSHWPQAAPNLPLPQAAPNHPWIQSAPQIAPQIVPQPAPIPLIEQFDGTWDLYFKNVSRDYSEEKVTKGLRSLPFSTATKCW